MFYKLFKFLSKLFLFCVLTLITQIGGIVYLIAEFTIKNNTQKYLIKKTAVFIIIYCFATFLIVPYIAPVFGREKIQDTTQIQAHSFFTKLFNRNYVNPKLHITLKEIANSLKSYNPKIKLVYLDANFPFIDGFPLAPHVSHKDGKKIDISFVYEDKNQIVTNQKLSNSGYGVFEEPINQEYNQSIVCKEKGYWQYNFTRYFTFGSINKHLFFSEKATKKLLLAIINQKQVHKIFIEPHLKNRLHLQSSKIRFHGCQAVRHDDHIHFQIN